MNRKDLNSLLSNEELDEISQDTRFEILSKMAQEDPYLFICGTLEDLEELLTKQEGSYTDIDEDEDRD